MGYRVLSLDAYYRKGMFRHFAEDCKCSVSMTERIDVTELYAYSRKTETKFYINFLYLLTKTLNAREDYRLVYRYQTQELLLYDQINPIQYVFHPDTETFTVAYTEYCAEYPAFYDRCADDLALAAQTRAYGLDSTNHPNWFDASYIPWRSYDALHVELPDGHLYFPPVVNWGKFREEAGRLMMPLTVRLNHAAADGYLVALVYTLLEQEMAAFVSR